MRLLSYDQLKSEKGVPYSRSWIARMIAVGKFPAPITLGSGGGSSRIAWRDTDIDAWITKRAKLPPVKQSEKGKRNVARPVVRHRQREAVS